MQLTDRVLLPATISYTDSGQRSTSPSTDDVARPTAVCQTESAAETGDGEVHNVTLSADGEGEVGAMHNSSACSVTVAIKDSVTGCVEANKSASASSQAAQDPTDTADNDVSVMSVSLVDFPSYVHDAMETGSLSCSTLLQSLPTTVDPSSAANQAVSVPTDNAGSVSLMTVSLVNLSREVDIRDTMEVGSAALLPSLPATVHIDSKLLHSADTNIIITDPTEASDSQSAACSTESSSTAPMSHAVSDCNDSSQPSQPTEWTR